MPQFESWYYKPDIADILLMYNIITLAYLLYCFHFILVSCFEYNSCNDCPVRQNKCALKNIVKNITKRNNKTYM